MERETGNGDTLPKLLKCNYEKYGDRKIAMRKKDFGIWYEYTWKDSYQIVKYFSLGLISLGFEPKDNISIIGDNDPQWYWATYAVQAAHGAVTGIFVDATPPEIKYFIDHSDSKFVLAKDQEQIDKILEIIDELPKVKKVIYWDPKGLWNYEEPALMSFDQVAKLGKKYEETYPGLFEQNVERTREDDIGVLCYTSGTTGLPKGAMLHYKYLIGNYSSIVKSGLPLHETDNYLSYISPAWAFEHVLGTAGHQMTGFTVNFPEGPETVQENTKEISPQLLMYNSRLWESVLRNIQVKITDTSVLRRFIYNLFLPVNYKMADLCFSNKTSNLLWKALSALAYVAAFRPLRDQFGLLKIKLAITSGAALSPQAFRFFRGMGINLNQLYGLTETGIASSHRPGNVKFDSVGPADPEKIKISSEGEILVSGGSIFAGYYKDKESYERRVKDGWLHTDDAGYIDEDGHLIFYDRMEDLRVLASGYKFAPQYIEGSLKFSTYIKDAVVIGGEDREFVGAIINIDFDNVGKWAEKHHVAYTTYIDLSQKPQVYELISRDIARVNRTLPEPSRVKKYVLLHKEFDPDEAELTRTRKLRRAFIEQRYAELIEALYSNESKVTTEAEIKYRDGRKGKIITTIHIGEVK